MRIKLKKVLHIFAVLGGAVLCVMAWRLILPADLNKHPNRPGIVYWHGDPSEKKIALTFDDGPNDPYTSQVLEVLKENNIKATFFLIGKNVQKYPEVARKVVEAGHVIGNHTYDHPDLIFKSGHAVDLELDEAEQVIEKATGQRPRLFRPPFGADDPFTFHQAEKMGYVVVKWSVSGRDWERPGVPKIEERIMRHMTGGAIILMHDGNETLGGDRSQTVEAIRYLIPELKKQGYTFVTVPELLDLSGM